MDDAILPVDVLYQIALNWPARNALARTCRQAIMPPPSAYVERREITTQKWGKVYSGYCDYLPNDIIHGERRLDAVEPDTFAQMIFMRCHLGGMFESIHSAKSGVTFAYKRDSVFASWKGFPVAPRRITYVRKGSVVYVCMPDNRVIAKTHHIISPDVANVRTRDDAFALYDACVARPSAP